MSVKRFEEVIAEYYNAKYAVAVDCCTHAIELCLRYTQANNVTCPVHTYASVPMTFEKLNLTWAFKRYYWINHYTIENTNIIDAAVFWKQNGYVPSTMMCLSFQFKKHLNLGRGGMILLDDSVAYQDLCKMRYDGRTDDKPWAEQQIETVGYHYYMTPEIAELGVQEFQRVKNLPPKRWSFEDYPDLSKLPVFKNATK